MIEDKILVWQLRCGRREAMARIYGKYEPMLLTIAAGILGDVAGAEDVVHDVFMALAQSPDKVRLDGHLKNFLAVCVTNRAKDRLRSRRDSVSLDDIEFHVPVGQQPEVLASQQEHLQLAWSSLAQLPPEQREVVVLHLIAGLIFRQIASNLDISINTAQSRYRYGLEKLRTLFNGELER
jgi:RNA polymerase sigma-70 factor (ECF subfamily)